jgi:aryl-alcohol dehydrogenase-like predicted oxidoreductase
MIPYSPLGNGMLTGKHRRGVPPLPGSRLAVVPGANASTWLTNRNFDILEALERFAQDRDLTVLDIAIGGLAAQPQVVSVIAGAMSPEQVQANAQAGRWRPTAADLEELDRIAPRE